MTPARVEIRTGRITVGNLKVKGYHSGWGLAEASSEEQAGLQICTREARKKVLAQQNVERSTTRTKKGK